MADLIPRSTVLPTVAQPAQARDDAHLVRLWLHGKSANTRAAYEHDVRAFIDFADVPLPALTLQHLHDWANHLAERELAAATRARKLSAVKSLLTFGHRLGYLTYNVGAAVRPPKSKDTLAERILPEDAVHRVLALAEQNAASQRFVDQRNAVLVRLFYASGGRVSELRTLTWQDTQPRDGTTPPTGQLTLFGKGQKTRHVLLSAATWAVLQVHRGREKTDGFGEAEHPVFRSTAMARSRDSLSRQQIWRVVKRLAKQAGLPDAVSPHWLRHAHVSHALDRGAPPHLVQQTVGHASLQTTSRYAHARPDDSSARYLGV
ncbi:MAG: tyrosine-type recombinase/integrase [Bacteroidota bacterium]